MQLLQYIYVLIVLYSSEMCPLIVFKCYNAGTIIVISLSSRKYQSSVSYRYLSATEQKQMLFYSGVCKGLLLYTCSTV